MAISILPPEILSTIFSFVLVPSKRQGVSYQTQYAFSQVCQSWRSIALADPTLWRVLKTQRTPPKWVPELIRRSRAFNLDVELKNGVHPDTLQAITTHFSGIGILRVHLCSRNFILSFLHGCVKAISNQELPLRVLEVSSRSSHIVDDELEFPTPVDQDIAAIIARCPRLQEITFGSGVNLLWGMPLPSSLTTLQLHGVERPSLNVFLDVLRQAPNLRRLYLGTCGPKDGIGPLPPISTHKVDLPHLASVSLGIVDLATESFFQYLNFPGQEVDFTFENGYFFPPGEQVPVLRYIADRFQHPEDRLRWPALRQLRIEIYSGSIRLDLGLSPELTQARNFQEWKSACPSHQLDPEKNVALRFRRCVDGEPNDGPPEESCIPLFVQLSRCLPLRNLEVLDLEGWTFDSFTPRDLTDLLSNLPELVYFKARGSNTSPWEALEGLQKAARPPGVVFLPKLRYVEVNMNPYGYGGTTNARDASLDFIKEWLVARAASDGLKLVRLELAYWEYEEFDGAIPGFETLADVVLYTNYEYCSPRD